MRSFTIAIVAFALVAPLGLADAPAPAAVSAVLAEGDATSDAVSYSHSDCVGPGLPGTAPTHPTHTTRVSGFVIAPSKPITINVYSLTPFGAGICPTILPGPVLQEDYTGTFRLTGVCRGTINEGALFFDFTMSFLGGIPQGTGGTSGSCVGTLNSAFSVDLTVSHSQTAFFGIPLGPLGGIRHAMSQA